MRITWYYGENVIPVKNQAFVSCDSTSKSADAMMDDETVLSHSLSPNRPQGVRVLLDSFMREHKNRKKESIDKEKEMERIVMTFCPW